MISLTNFDAKFEQFDHDEIYCQSSKAWIFLGE